MIEGLEEMIDDERPTDDDAAPRRDDARGPNDAPDGRRLRILAAALIAIAVLVVAFAFGEGRRDGEQNRGPNTTPARLPADRRS